MVKLLVLAALLTGCFDDRYHCTTDAQCDLGDGGRCEIDGRCSHFDLTCPTQRRYSEHAGDETNQCFDDRMVVKNVCAGGQPPAKPEGCSGAVCERLPACCEMGWTDACAQLAEEVCPDVTCDTRIAVNAIRGSMTERYELIWDGTAWTIASRNELGEPLAWVGPPPGESAPRLASTGDGVLEIDNTLLPVDAGRTYSAITSIGFDRDRRDTIVAAYSTANGQGVEVWKLSGVDTPVVRDSQFGASSSLSWGDDNRDGFPDAIIKNNGATYYFFDNVDSDNHERRLLNQSAATISGGATPGSPQLRAFDWLDINGDTKLDLAVFGNSLRVHSRPDDLVDTPQLELDCDPPTTARACQSDPEPNLEQTSFTGCALPTAADPSLLAAVFPGRKLYRVNAMGVATQLPFQNDACTCAKTCTSCPGANCSCTYDCTACAPILALATRDLDGDHLLDIIAIDAKLRMYIGLAAAGYAFGSGIAIVSPVPQNFVSVNLSVSGAPTP